MFGIVTDFGCLKSQYGVQCPIAISQAIHESGLDVIFAGEDEFEIHDLFRVLSHTQHNSVNVNPKKNKKNKTLRNIRKQNEKPKKWFFFFSMARFCR